MLGSDQPRNSSFEVVSHGDVELALAAERSSRTGAPVRVADML